MLKHQDLGRAVVAREACEATQDVSEQCLLMVYRCQIIVFEPKSQMGMMLTRWSRWSIVEIDQEEEVRGGGELGGSRGVEEPMLVRMGVGGVVVGV